jgi:hypothetical protein
MAKNDTYEVIADQYTIHKQVGSVTDPVSGEVTDVQQGQGKVYFRGDVIPAGEISPLLLAALEDEDHPSHDYVAARIQKSGDDPREALSPRLGEPFAGYDDMEENEVVNAMRNLPSAAIVKIKEYEEAHDGRDAIIGYNIGFGESPIARQTGLVSSEHQDTNEDKESAKLTTREVPEEGVVQPGEGITGTGDPQIPHGSIKEEEEGGQRKGAQRRRSRRARPASDSGGSGGSEGSSE